MRLSACLLLPALLSGCASTSFAPPAVTVAYQNGVQVEQTICPVGGSRGTAVTVTRDVAGAYKLLDKFIETFRCSAHSAANGRQAFEIPGFLATTGAAVASALGGGATYGIVGTGASSLFSNGNKYWDPKLKAAIYDHALDAMICIKTEAVGIPAFKFDNAAQEQQKNLLLEELGGTPKVSVPVDQQYFEMVSGAAFSVERILAQRLSNMASVDAAAVSAELTAAIEERKAKEKERTAALAGGTSGQSGDGHQPTPPVAGQESDLEKAMKGWALRVRDQPKQATVDLDLQVLKPKLDECVIRAKL